LHNKRKLFTAQCNKNDDDDDDDDDARGAKRGIVIVSRPSVGSARLSVRPRPSVCDVGVPWAYVLG